VLRSKSEHQELSRKSGRLQQRQWYVHNRRHRIDGHVRIQVKNAVDNVTLIQGTSDVRLDPQLNKKVWEAGIKGVPYRLRVRISRKRNDEEGAKEKLYSYVQAVNVKNAKGLQTALVEDS
jgi:large subunit ribosomal protein L31e